MDRGTEHPHPKYRSNHYPEFAHNEKEKAVVTKNMKECAFTISVTWQDIAAWLEGNGMKVTDETLNWALATLTDPDLIPGDMTHRGSDFWRRCGTYLATHPEHEA